MDKPQVRLLDDSDEFYIDEGCYIRELNNTAEDPEVSIAMARVPPGKTTEWHRLKGISERYVIQEGMGMVEIGNMPATKVCRGDTVLIPPDCRQRISNPGDSDLVFLAICSPRFSPDCYQAITD
jgi:mannose-6-phosphate isomerase-like protein (cupin superfamily)